MKFFYVKRQKIIDGKVVDLGTIDIPEKDLETTLKQNPEWKVVEENAGVTEIVPPVKTEGFTCPICGKSVKSERGLKIHKSAHQ